MSISRKMDSFSLINAAKKFLCNGRQLSLVEEKGHCVVEIFV